MTSKKVVIIGDTGVGKTSILFRYLYNKYDENLNSTFGAGFKTKDVPYNDDGDKLKLNLWDTAGQERFEQVTKLYFRDAEAAIVVYDLTHEDSFKKAQKWVQILEEERMGSQEQPRIEIVLVGNKCDRADEKTVSTEEAEEYCKNVGAIHCEVSAKENIGIDNIFTTIAKVIHH